VTKIHENISNSRKDDLHKLSSKIVKGNSLISIEDLDIKGLLKGNSLSAHILDASWGEFTRQLEYKSKWYGRDLIKVGRFYPSTKTCHKCGWVNKDLKLSDRKWTCVNGHQLDRDINAAKNILNEGLKIHGEGLAIT